MEIKAFLEIVRNIFLGLYNNLGLIGIVIIVILCPIAFIVLLTLYTIKYGLKLIILLIDETNYYISHWLIATYQMFILLYELLKKKIFVVLIYLWEKLFDDDIKLLKSEMKLTKGWIKDIIHSLIGLFYIIPALLLVGISLSSLIYYQYVSFYDKSANLLLLWICRLMLLTPLIHRVIRYKFANKKFTWSPESRSGWYIGAFIKKWLFVLISLVIIILIIFIVIFS